MEEPDADFQAPVPALRQVHRARRRGLPVLRDARPVRAGTLPQLPDRDRRPGVDGLPEVWPGAHPSSPGRTADTQRSANDTQRSGDHGRPARYGRARPDGSASGRQMLGVRRTTRRGRPFLHGMRHAHRLS